MPDFTLRHPDSGEEYVIGNASDRARLLSQGYHDVTDESAPTGQPAPSDQDTTPAPGPAPTASTTAVKTKAAARPADTP
jgi:hypothetical protein